MNELNNVPSHRQGLWRQGFPEKIDLSLAKKISETPPRLMLYEAFCDALCLRFTFDLKVDAFLDAWARYFINFVELDMTGYYAQTEGSVGSQTDVLLGSQTLLYYMRLILVCGFGLWQPGIDPGVLYQESLKKTFEVINGLAQQLDFVKSRVAPKFLEICRQVYSPRQETLQGYEDEVKEFHYWIRAIRTLMEKLMEAAAPPVVSMGEEAQEVVRNLRSGRIWNRPIRLPLLALQELGRNADLASSIAAILSFDYLDEMANLSSPHGSINGLEGQNGGSVDVPKDANGLPMAYASPLSS